MLSTPAAAHLIKHTINLLDDSQRVPGASRQPRLYFCCQKVQLLLHCRSIKGGVGMLSHQQGRISEQGRHCLLLLLLLLLLWLGWCCCCCCCCLCLHAAA